MYIDPSHSIVFESKELSIKLIWDQLCPSVSHRLLFRDEELSMVLIWDQPVSPFADEAFPVVLNWAEDHKQQLTTF